MTDTAIEIPDAELVERAVRSARSRHVRKGELHPRWFAVRDVFCCGSTVATQLCRRFNLDPDEEVKR